MGEFKALLDVGGKPAAARQADALREAGVSEIVFVTGHERERLADLIRAKGAVEAFNERFADGMFTSVKTGLEKALSLACGSVSAFLLLPVDCPLASVSAIRSLLDAHMKNPGRFIVPCYRGKKGHPLLIPAEAVPEITAHGGDGGLKAVTAGHGDMIRVETDDEGVVLDMDSPAGYEEIKAYCARVSAPDAILDARAAIRLFTGRIFLIRHGETREHAEKIFLGQTDVPLSDKGREQAAAAGKKLSERGAEANVVYTSDLVRASETAEIIAKALGASKNGLVPSIARDARLREIHLGDWEGRFIREIKESCPDEYARRGENILTWKIGHEGENYYDLRYRAEKWLRDTLPGAHEIVAAAHIGVIRVILAAFSGIAPLDAWMLKIPRGSVIELNVRSGELLGG
jgi:broad specificity phosphatase PhoE/CTP:molybdopterin cytidylyltransferase MocA